MDSKPRPGSNPRRGIDKCDAPWCDKLILTKDWCSTHYSQMVRDGKLTPPRTLKINYRTAHLLVVAARGPASVQQCGTCGNPADEWSLNKDHPSEFHIETDETRWHGRQYSLDPSAYEPRCIRCHRQEDKPSGVHPNAKLAAAAVIEIYSSTEREVDLAERYGVKPSTIGMIRRGETWRKITAPLSSS